MRIQISCDSASEKQLRMLLAAIAQIGKSGECTVGLNGPERYSAQTPHLTERQFALVVGKLVVGRDGEPIADVVNRLEEGER